MGIVVAQETTGVVQRKDGHLLALRLPLDGVLHLPGAPGPASGASGASNVTFNSIRSFRGIKVLIPKKFKQKLVDPL